MMLTGRNEWLVIGALILWIAFVPCPYAMKQFFASPVGKVAALGAVVYSWKYVSEPVAVLLLVAFLRSGAVREFADDPSMQPATSNCHCESGFDMDPATKQCKKGTETKPAQCCGMDQEWDGSKCKDLTPPPTTAPAGGPEGGSTGSAAAMASLSAPPDMPPVTEGFSAYGGKDKDFAPA
jgi:hypothetical protein